MKRLWKVIPGLVCLLACAAWAGNGSGEGKSIHVDLKSTEGDGMELKMTLPISFIETLRPKIEEALSSVRYQDHEIDFVEIWNSVKDSGPTEFVEIKSHDGDIKVSTTHTHLVIRVDEKNEGHQIDVTLPLALGDALFSNLDTIDYDGIIDALLSMEGQDLVKITSEKINGRVWIE